MEAQVKAPRVVFLGMEGKAAVITDIFYHRRSPTLITRVDQDADGKLFGKTVDGGEISLTDQDQPTLLLINGAQQLDALDRKLLPRSQFIPRLQEKGIWCVGMSPHSTQNDLMLQEGVTAVFPGHWLWDILAGRRLCLLRFPAGIDPLIGAKTFCQLLDLPEPTADQLKPPPLPKASFYERFAQLLQTLAALPARLCSMFSKRKIAQLRKEKR